MMTAILIAADLFSAIQAQDLPRVRQILSEDPSLVNTPDAQGIYPLSHALGARAGEGFVPRRENRILEEILSHRPRLTREQACAVGTAQEVEAILLADPAFVASVAKNGWTPLHFAAFGDNPETARALISRGADVNARSQNQFRNTPLQVAQLNRGHAVTKELIARGADVNVEQAEGVSALDEAASSGDLESIGLLLKAGATNRVRARALAEKNHHSAAVALLR